jgi:hypothetical protein
MNALRRRWPRPRDIRCQTRPLARREPTAQRTLAACSRVERADLGERHAMLGTPPPSNGRGPAGAALMAPRGVSDQDAAAPGSDGAGARILRMTAGSCRAKSPVRQSEA